MRIMEIPSQDAQRQAWHRLVPWLAEHARVRARKVVDDETDVTYVVVAWRRLEQFLSPVIGEADVLLERHGKARTTTLPDDW